MVLKIGIYSGAAEHLMGINKEKINFPVNFQGTLQPNTSVLFPLGKEFVKGN